jgi:hypothetical protein
VKILTNHFGYNINNHQVSNFFLLLALYLFQKEIKNNLYNFIFHINKEPAINGKLYFQNPNHLF